MLLGIPVDDSENDVGVDFTGHDEKGTTMAGAHFRNILRKVRRESSEDFMDAVGYCLKQGTAPGVVVRADLESCLDHVVEP